MPLDAAQRAKADAWFKEKQALQRCPGCGKTAWDYGDELVAVTLLDGTELVLGSGVPIQVVCTNCGFLAHYAANPMGLL